MSKLFFNQIISILPEIIIALLRQSVCQDRRADSITDDTIKTCIIMYIST